MMMLPACLVAEADEYKSTPEYQLIAREGVQWVYRVEYVHTVDGALRPCETTMTIEFKGDTVINGLKYKKCYRTYGTNDKGWCNSKRDGISPDPDDMGYELTTDPTLIAFVEDQLFSNRPNANVKYYIATVIYTEQFMREMHTYNQCVEEFDDLGICTYGDPNQAYLLYYLDRTNWSNETGKTPITNFYYKRNVLLNRNQMDNEFNFHNTCEITINGEPRVCISNQIADESTQCKYYTAWIEGIGFIGHDVNWRFNHGGCIISPAASYRFFYAYTYFNHVVEDGKIVYKSPNYQDLSQLQSGVGDVKVPQIETVDDSYYNLMGQPVSHPEDAPGIYIHEGKKVRF